MKKSIKDGQNSKKISDFFTKSGTTAPTEVSAHAEGIKAPAGSRLEKAAERPRILDLGNIGTPPTGSGKGTNSKTDSVQAVRPCIARCSNPSTEFSDPDPRPETGSCSSSQDRLQISDADNVDSSLVSGSETALTTPEKCKTEDDSENASPTAKKVKKTRKRKRATQLYCESWKTQLNWVAVSKKGPTHAYCKICRKNIKCSGGFTDLAKHDKRQSHIKASKYRSEPGKIENFVGAREKLKNAEMRFCAWAAEKNKTAVDVAEFIQISKIIFDDSAIARGMHIGRTKATAVTCNVIGGGHEQELKEILRTTKFSLIVDESTDVSTKKVLVMVVRTYTWQGEKLEIRDYFYQALELVEADAETIYRAIVNCFLEDNVPYKTNLAGFGADGCNVMHGKNKSVAVLLKQDCPHLFVLKCVCHSFALCSSYACKHIPERVEWLCKEVYSFLSNSPLRTAKLAELQSIMNLKPLKMLHPSATRWLSLEEVVKRMLDRFDVLKIYFNYVDATVDRKVQEKMKEILSVLNDPTTELYLKFLIYVLPKVNRLNKLFQSEAPQIYLLNSEVKRLYKDLLSNFMSPEYMRNVDLTEVEFKPGNYGPLDQMYLGTYIEAALSEAKLKPDVLNAFRLSIMNFYISLANQIQSRLNLDDPVLTSLAIIDPVNVKNKKHQSLHPVLKHFPNIVPGESLQAADDEFREILCMEELKDLDGSDGVIFWGKILATKRCDGHFAFPVLRDFIPTVLSLPHSSATVERIFSAWNYNKTKARNRLAVRTMNGILRAKEYVKTHKNEQGVVTLTSDTKKLFCNSMYNMKD